MDGQTKAGTWRTIRRLEKSIPQVQWYRGELMLMSLFVNIFALGLPIFILQVYDRILPNLGLTTMQFLVIGLVIVMILDFILKSIRAAVTTYTGARFEHLARVAAVDNILRTPQDVYEQETPGAYLDKVNAIGVVKEFYSSQLGTLFIDLPFAVFFLGMIWFLGGLMVVVPITLLTLFGIMAIIVGGNLRRAVDVRGQVDNRRYDFLIEIINGIHTVKAQAFKNLLQRRFEGLQETSARAVRSVAMQSAIAQGLGSTFGQLNMACVIGLGAVLVIQGNLSAGELAACTLLSGRAMQPLQSAMGLWTNFQTIRVACDSATSLMELPAEDLGAKPEIPKITGHVEFRNVTFGYAGMDEPLINNLNLQFKAGAMIGIEGDNSSGRSTLLKLMIGIIRPSSGQVLIDGHDIFEHQSHSYREQMAFLSADADVYTGTILDNMTYFRGGRYIKKAMDLSKKLGLDDEIKRLPEGYGTHIGDGAGGVLPAGFAQRITIVRAMVDDPKIVLFDNANDGLDSNTDRILLDYLSGLRGKATVILVSARPSWLRVADTRYVMSHGDVKLKVEDKPEPAPIEKPVAASQIPEAAKPSAPEPIVSKPEPQPTANPPKEIKAQPTAKQQPAPKPKQAPQQDKQQPKPQPKPVPTPALKQTQRPNRPVQAAPAPRKHPNPAPKPASAQKKSAQPQRASIQKPAAQKAASRPAARPQAKPVARPISKPNISNQQRPANQQRIASQNAPKRPTPSATKPAQKTPVQPTQNKSTAAVKQAPKPITRSANKPVNRPVTRTAGKPTTKPSPNPVTRPVGQQDTTNKTEAPATRPQARPVVPPRPTPIAEQNRSTSPDTKPKPPLPTQAAPTQAAPNKVTSTQPNANQSALSPNKTAPTQAEPTEATPKPRPSARPIARPVARPVTTAANQRPAPAAPKPAATLRPASATKNTAAKRPEPPKPRRIDPQSAGLGGVE